MSTDLGTVQTIPTGDSPSPVADVPTAPTAKTNPVVADEVTALRAELETVKSDLQMFRTDVGGFINDMKTGNLPAAFADAFRTYVDGSESVKTLQADVQEAKETVNANADVLTSVENDYSKFKTDINKTIDDMRHLRISRVPADAAILVSDIATDEAELKARIMGK